MFENAFEQGYLDALNEIKDNYYEEINGDHITDVFSNFEDKFGEDDTTMIKVNDIKQKDRFYSSRDGLDRPNMLKMVHEKNKNIGVENKVFCSRNCINEDEYEDAYLEGYYDAITELNEGVKTKVGLGVAGLGLAAGIGVGAYKKHKMNTDLNYRRKQAAKKDAKLRVKWEKYKANGGELDFEDWKNPNKREHERYKASGGTKDYDSYMKHKAEQAAKAKAEREERARKAREEEDRRLAMEERRARINRMNAAASVDREKSLNTASKRAAREEERKSNNTNNNNK